MRLFNQHDPDELNDDAESASSDSEITGNSFDNDLPDGLKKDEETEGEQLGFTRSGGKNTPIG